MIESSAPPYLQCIQWVPRRFAGGISPVTIVDLVFEQRVFAEVARHARATPDTPVFGALVGHLFEDPTCERRWAHVERIIRSPVSIPESADASRLGQTLRATEMEWVPEEGEVLLGWYRTHLEGGLYLSPEEARFHEGGFPEPWSVALVLAGTGERRAGGVFQRTDPEGLSRSIYTPFYELVDPSSEFNGTTRRTFVGWVNYQTETRVHRAGRGSVSAELPPRKPGPWTGTNAPEDAATTDPGASRAPEAHPGSETRAVGRPEARARDRRDTTAGRPPDAPPTSSAKPAGPEQAPARSATPGPAPAKSTVPGPERATTPAPSDRVPVDAPPEPVGPITAPGARDARTGPDVRDAGTDPGARDTGGPPPSRPSRPPKQSRPSARRDEPVDSEAEWEKRQIQRSLMAVGRSLSPSDLGALGAPAPRDAAPSDDAASADRDDDATGTHGPTAARETVRPPANDAGSSDPGPRVIPIHPDLHRPRRRLNRRSRPRPNLRKMLAAAAGLTLVATAGMVGARTMMRDDAAAGPDGAAAEESVAGLTLAPDELRRRDPRSASPGDAATSEPARDATPIVGDTRSRAGTDDETGAGPSTTTEFARADVAEAETTPTAPRTGGEEATPSRATARPPALENIEVEDPLVAVYESTLAIFLEEVGRYETVRHDFDEGSVTCNPLNLSYRGVRDAFTRLEQRRDEAGERLPGASLRTFESAERQFAMIRTHYTLTDCPMPVGG